jgi:hypothetical protein
VDGVGEVVVAVVVGLIVGEVEEEDDGVEADGVEGEAVEEVVDGEGADIEHQVIVIAKFQALGSTSKAK